MALYWSESAAERRSGQWRHQDRHLVYPLPDGRIIMAVIDGHGESDNTPDFCAKRLPELLADPDLGNIVRHDRIITNLLDDLTKGTADFEDGAAISLAILDRDLVTIATLGDTFACMGSISGEAVMISWLRPHEVFGNDAERDRLHLAGASVGNGFVRTNEKHGLALSRSLGDKDFAKLVSREPVMLATRLSVGGFVLLGTDGYFKMAMPELMRMNWLWGLERQWDAEQFLIASEHALRVSADDATIAVAYLRSLKD